MASISEAGWKAVTLVALAMTPAAAWAEAAPECASVVKPGGELAPWTAPRPLVATADPASAAELRVGQAVELALHPAAHVTFPARPGREGGSGGLVAVTIREPSTYRVALGTAGWIDLTRDGKAVVSTAHGHGEPCTGIRKVVDFPLTTGRYVLAVSGSPDQRARVLIVRKP